MKILFRNKLRFAPLLLLFLVGTVVPVRAQGSKLRLEQLDVLANKANETVDVSLDEHLIQTTAKFFSDKDKDDVEIKNILKGLKGIYVRSYSFEKEGEYGSADVEVIMVQLRSPAWSKIVTVKSRKDGENVEVYLMNVGDQINGLVVLSIEPKEFTVVNIVGPVDLEKLSKLEGQFGVPELGIETAKPKKTKDKDKDKEKDKEDKDK